MSRRHRRALHPEARAFLDQVAAAGLPRLSELSPGEARAQADAEAAAAPRGADVAAVEEFTIAVADGEIRARRYRPEQAHGVVVWLHGGGWVLCGLDSHDAMCRRLANAAGCAVVGVEYRLAPEHRFPVGLEDSYAALQYVARRDPTLPLVVGGDSAGGNLAAVCALRARDRGGPELALQVLACPVTDHDMTTKSYVEHGGSETLLGRAEMEWCWNHYLPDAAARGNADASPLRASDFHGLPPAVVVVAGHDPLRDEGLAYAERLREAGVPVDVHRYDDMFHEFFPSVDLFSRAREAVDAVGAAILRELVYRNGDSTDAA